MCDFGFARYAVNNAHGIMTVGGSEGYNAPEIFTLSSIDLKRCDLFSLGVVYFVI